MIKTQPNPGPVLCIDWSVISYKCWHKMGSDNYVKRTKSEKAEFGMNIFLYLTYLVNRFKPSELIFAVDSRPNWRQQYYKDYYIKSATIYQHETNDEYIVEWDYKIHKFVWNEELEIWVKSKLKVAEIKDLVIGTDEERIAELAQLKKKDHNNYIWDKFAESVEGYVKEEDPVKKNVILYTDLKDHTPYYKKRPSNWPYVATKEEYRLWSRNLAFNIAPNFGAKAIYAEGAEADDIIAAYAEGRAKTGRDFICVSVDQDLYQLNMKNMFFKYFNPNGTKDAPSKHGVFVKLTPEKAKYELYKKILAGDSSDFIFATSMKNQRKLMSASDADKIMLKEEKPLEFAQKNVNRDVLIKNTTLIHLSKRPKYIFDNIIKAIKSYKEPAAIIPMEKFNVTVEDELLERTMAEEHRKIDLSTGLVGE